MARPTLMRHRKFIRLSVALGSEYIARGVLEILWDGAYESGDERVGSADEIEARVRWQGERGVLASALVSSGFVDLIGDDEHAIHDLWHHAPDYVTKRRQRELQRNQRVPLSAVRRRSAPKSAAKRTGSPKNGVTPSPARAPSPAPTPTQREQSVSSAPSGDDAKPAVVALRFPVVGGEQSEWALTADMVAEWQATYTGLDVMAQCRRALTWVKANPGNRKTASGMPRFLVNWLARETNSGRGREPPGRSSGDRARQAMDSLRVALEQERALTDGN